ncbi:MAG: LacI family DNA-binding transcriptional regulator [Betaproteobacteria bacterium]
MCKPTADRLEGTAISQERLRDSFVTAAEIAEHAGVSRSAVSRTFTPGASVSSAVRARVLESAGQLGYRVNRLAQGLINARSNIVGLLGADLHQPFHAEILAALSGALLADGFQCMLLNAANAAHDMGALIERVLEYRVRAIVVMNGTPPSRIVQECLGSGVPVILINKPMPGLAVDTVVTDHAAGGRAAAAQLLAAGCRRLAVVSSSARTASLMGRLEAFCRHAAEAGMPVRIWQQGPTDYATGREAALAMLRDDAIDGAFCVTDLLALGFLDAARLDRQRRVPDDLSVIGFDDIPQAAWNAYQLTTFRQPVRLLTDQVMHVIRQRAETPELPHAVFTLPASPVVRITVRGHATRKGST